MCDVVSVLLQIVVEPVKTWICGKIEDIRGVEEEVKNIRSHLSNIVKVLETRGVSNEDDRHWPKILFDAQDILDIYETEDALSQINKQTFRWIRKECFKFKLATKIKEISEALDKENKNAAGDSSKRSQNDDKQEDFRESGSFSEKDFVGRKDEKDKLIYQMISVPKQNPINVVPIIGMSGIGKTSLAQQIYNDMRIKEHFGKDKMWTTVTVPFDFEKFLDELSSFLNKKEKVLLARDDVQNEKKNFLLILDDVQDISEHQWKVLTSLLKGKCMESILLVTTQNSDLARRILGREPSPESNLTELPEEDCKELLRRIASSTGSLPKNLEDNYVGKIIQKCSGSPMAVEAIAWVLRGNVDESKWKNILEIDLLKHEQGNVLPVLRYAYDRLPSIFRKQCFAYCSIFPKGTAFGEEELVKLWMAKAFIDPSENEKDEATIKQDFDELLGRSFFQEVCVGNKVRYKLHDLMHELAQSISRPQCCQVKDQTSRNFSDELLHVSLLCQDVEELVGNIVAKSKKLRTLRWPGASLKNFGKTLDKIFKTLKYIRVLDLSSSSLEDLPQSVAKLKLLRYLDLSNTEIRVLPDSTCSLYNLQTLKLLGCVLLWELPKDLGKLVNLRYLDLSNTKIRVLPDSICNLHNLQTLKLLGCVWLLELPKDLGKLDNLLHLELDDIFWYHCTELPPNMGKITRLHNLHVFPVGSSGHGIEELKNMEYLTGNLHISKLEIAVNAAECKLYEKKSLEKVVLEWSEEYVNQQDEVAVMQLQDLRPHSNLEELEIRHFKGSSFPSWFRGGDLENLVTLSLDHCTKCRRLSVGQLKCLRVLCIKGMLDLEEWSEADRCTSLLNLKISNCPRLRMLPYSMPKLKSLKIKYCHSLKALPIAPVEFLLLIDNLVLEDWREATLYLYRGPFTVTGPSSLFWLIELKIINCPKIPALPENFFPQKLEIGSCKLLTELPDRDFAIRLQHLALDSCSNGKILKTIPNTNYLDSLVISSISNLPSLPKELHLPWLKTLYISNCEELTSLYEQGGSMPIFSSLKLLSVRGCPELESLPDDLPTTLECLIIGSCHLLKSLGAGGTLKSLLLLKDMYIEDCPSLMSFPEVGLPASLQHLLIQGCPELTAKCQKDGAEWAKIQNVPDLEIDSIKTSSAKDVQKEKSSSSSCWYPFNLQ